MDQIINTEAEDPIKIGDEIRYYGEINVVTGMNEDYYRCITGVNYPKGECVKTGRHYSEIPNILSTLFNAKYS